MVTGEVRKLGWWSGPFVYLSMLSAFSVSVGMSWTVNNGHFFFFLKQRSKMLEVRRQF